MNAITRENMLRMLPIVILVIFWLLGGWTPVALLGGLAAGATVFFASQVGWCDWLLFLIEPIYSPLPDKSQITGQLIEMSIKARKDGILSLESIPCEFQILGAAKQYTVDGVEPEYLTFIMGRGQHAVLARAAAVRDGATNILLAWGLLLLFLAGNTWVEGNPTGLSPWLGMLFAVLFLLVLVRGHFQNLLRDLGSLYDLVTDGMTGIQRGVTPRLLQETLTADHSFGPTAEDGLFPFASPWQITPETVQEKLAAYLSEHHPRFRRVNAVLQEKDPKGNATGKPAGFWNLTLMDERSFQTLLREVSVEEWVSALKGAGPEMVRMVIANCSPRAGEFLLSELTREKFLSEEGAIKAQTAILKMARRLEAEGCIVIMGQGLTALEESLDNFLEVGRRAILNAGRIIRDIRKENVLGTLFKEDGSPATEGDKQAEWEIRSEIAMSFPDHRLHGEEFGEEGGESSSPYLWAFDPIDGTWSFVNHETSACTVLVLLKGEEIVLGLVYNPFTDELFEASAKGCFVNGRSLPLLQSSGLAEGVMNYQIPRRMGEHIAPFLNMWQDRQVGKLISPGGSPIYAMALVAQGTYAVFVMAPNDRTPYPWDLTAGTALVRQAGGRVTDMDGHEIHPLTHAGWLVAGANAQVHEEALTLLRKYGLGSGEAKRKGEKPWI
ncbi:MAG: hypothetical protein HQL80_08025 [Magnetococcales bacterium]|nr:hypothetical protein [Magnetococcales bacterium]